MRRKPLPNADAIEARVRALCEAGEAVKTIRAAIRVEFEQSVGYTEISEWTQDIQDLHRQSNGLTTMLLTIIPDGYEDMEPKRRPFAHLSRPFDRCEAWAVRRSPVLSGERRYVVVPGTGSPIIIWARTIGEWIQAMRARGYRLQAYDPDESGEQSEMFAGGTVEPRRVAA